jgi:hypothetical protein
MKTKFKKQANKLPKGSNLDLLIYTKQTILKIYWDYPFQKMYCSLIGDRDNCDLGSIEYITENSV